MRSVVTRACLLVGGPLGGFLASFAFGLSTTICAVVALLVVPIAMIWLHERAAPKDSLLAWQNAKLQIRGLLHSRSVWGFAALAFLVLGVPDFHDKPLYYYRIDVLHFSPNLIGWLKAAAAAAGFAAAFIYYRARPRCSLEWLFVSSILLNVAGALAYLLYASPVTTTGFQGSAMNDLLLKRGGRRGEETAWVSSSRGAGRHSLLDSWSWQSLQRAQAWWADHPRAYPATFDIPALAGPVSEIEGSDCPAKSKLSHNRSATAWRRARRRRSRALAFSFQYPA